MGEKAWDRKTGRVVEMPGPTDGLESGYARGTYDGSDRIKGRYMCWYCGNDLVLRAIRADAKMTPHFSHGSSEECPTSPERRRQIDRDDQVVIDLRDRLIHAWPDTSVVLECPQHPHDPAAEPAGRGSQSPAIVIRDAEQILVVERPRRLPDTDQIHTRLRAVRARYGSDARHVWFLATDPLQFALCGRLEVTPSGLDKTSHATIAPTEQQLAIIAAGGGVYWLDGQQVLVPYGIREGVEYPLHAGEDWGFPGWRREPRRDWAISHPVPAPDATCWGLVPVSLHQLTKARASFDLAEAHDVMRRLEYAQRGRERWRRNHARELYQERHAPPPAPVASDDVEPGERHDADSPAGPAAAEQSALDPVAVPDEADNQQQDAAEPPPTVQPRHRSDADALSGEPTSRASVAPLPVRPDALIPAPRLRSGRLRDALRRLLGRE